MSTPPPAGGVARSSFVSRDESEITEFIRRVYADNRSTFAPITAGAHYEAWTHDLPVIGADRVRTSIDYTGTSEQGFTDLVFFVVHAGSVHITSRSSDVLAGRGDASFYPLGVPVDFAMQGFDVSTVRLSIERVRQVAEDISGLPGPQLAFHATTPVSSAMQRYWRATTALVSGALADPDSPMDSPLLAEDLARTVATAALHAFPNTTMTRQHEAGPGEVAPATIRRAAAHAEANAHRPVTLAEIAAAAGTSTRALQYGFRRHLGATPLGYLRRVRLERARQELQAADPTTGVSVAAVAARWGFATPSGFTAAYRSVFGEPPSATLRQ